MNVQKLIDERPMTSTQLIIIFSCFTLNILDGMDVVVVAYVAPRIMEAWSVSPQSFGLVFSAALLGMASGAMFISPYTDVIGRRKMVLLSVIIISIGMFLTAYASTMPQLISLRLFTGLGIGSMLASLTSVAAEYSSNRRRNLAIGFVLGGYPIGATLTGILAATLIPDYGWQSMFIAGGLISTLLLPVVYLLLPESLDFLLHKQPKNALKHANAILAKMKYESLQQLPELSQRQDKDDTISSNIMLLMSPERRNSTIKLWLSFFMAFFTLYFLMSWIPKIAEVSGWSVVQASYFMAVFNFGSFFGIVALGYISHIFGLRRVILIFMIFSTMLMIYFGVADLSSNMFMFILFILGFFVQGGFVGLYSVAARLYPAKIRTTGVGWGIGLGRFGAIISPILGGFAIGLNVPIYLIFILFAIPFVIS
ncbi:MAG: AAHS family 4-hydroxybenzoate transporter-like MFS transporter, partial [Gammaproteobacteria bacterium]